MPSASFNALQERAALYRYLREFFWTRSVLEVETPALSVAAVSDPYIQPVEARVMGGARYLHTSPEYPMKRLLCAGSGSIYQICKVFRDGEAGGRHNPEFTMLEWYRTEFDHRQLMDEVAQLVMEYLEIYEEKRYTYQSLFEDFTGINPHIASNQQLIDFLDSMHIEFPDVDRLGLLDLILTHHIEPQLPKNTLVFVEDFPQDQAALAKIISTSEGVSVAKRFELYVNGVELANGYWELTDAQEQLSRFQQDQALRQSIGIESKPIDEAFIQAMSEGMPECAGVAMGLDRLLMLKLGTEQIADVLSFDFSRA